MDKIVIPESYNYIGVFLTFLCNLRCSYCLNHQYGIAQEYKHMQVSKWIKGLNRIVTRPDLPITLQGGEPTLYHGLYDIINNVNTSINIDILTNGMFDVEDFIKHVKPERLRRESKYASIRVSYHCEQMGLENTMSKVLRLMQAGFSVGVWIVDHPAYTHMNRISMGIMQSEGIDCRMKEFLGEWHGRFYGSYKYPDGVDKSVCKSVLCRPSEMLIAPDGSIHKCHNSLYTQQKGYAHILDEKVALVDEHVPCDRFGQCNSCDIKLKTNRFQEDGHCSVDVRA